MLLGRQIGREITLEVAYDVKLPDPSLPAPGDFDSSTEEQPHRHEWRLDEAWFQERLEQYKAVHKEPPLELVGWWTLSPPEGPGPEVLGIHRHVLQRYNEAAVLLGFHSGSVHRQQELSGKGLGGGRQMPLTIFESVYEAKRETGKLAEADVDEMQIEVEGPKGGGQKSADASLDIKLKELPYEIVTGEAEMISVDFVAKGGGNATAIETGAGKGKGKEKEETPQGETSWALNPEEEERLSPSPFSSSKPLSSLLMNTLAVIAFLSSRANAIKMLLSRLSTIKSYLNSTPPSYLTDASLPSGAPAQSTATTPISHPQLRSIQALASRLPHLSPADTEAFEADLAAERTEVAIVSLLGSMGRSIAEAKELGRTVAAVEAGKSVSKKGAANRRAAEAGYVDGGIMGNANSRGFGGLMDVDELGAGGGGGFDEMIL